MDLIMKPFEYISLRKNDIILSSIEDNNLNLEEANRILERVEHLIRLLSPCRINKHETRKVLNDNIPSNYNFISIEDSLVYHWLIKAIDKDYTYVHAFNLLAQKENRKEKTVIYPVKDIDEEKLIRLFKKDQKSRITKIKMATLKEIIKRVQKQLDKLEHLIHGVKPTISFGDMDWKNLYSDINFSFVHLHFTKKGYDKIVQLKNNCEYLFNQLKDIDEYSELATKEFDAKVIHKIKGNEFEFRNEEFTPKMQSLYKDFYLSLIYIIDFYKDKFNNQALPPSQTDNDNQQETEHLNNIITHNKNKEIVEGIKVQYKNIKGKRLKLLLMALQHLQCLPSEQIAAKFHRCCKNDFNWDIAAYTAMNDYRYNDNIDKIEYKQMIKFLESIINTK